MCQRQVRAYLLSRRAPAGQKPRRPRGGYLGRRRPNGRFTPPARGSRGGAIPAGGCSRRRSLPRAARPHSGRRAAGVELLAPAVEDKSEGAGAPVAAAWPGGLSHGLIIELARRRQGREERRDPAAGWKALIIARVWDRAACGMEGAENCEGVGWKAREKNHSRK